MALVDATDEELAKNPAQPGSINGHKVEYEFRRRELQVSREVAEAQIKAANWTRWSAVAVGASAVIAAIGVGIAALGVWVDWVQ